MMEGRTEAQFHISNMSLLVKMLTEVNIYWKERGANMLTHLLVSHLFFLLLF